MDTVHGILQARILEWVAFPFPRGSSQTQGLNLEIELGLPHCRQILCQLRHKGRRVESNYLSEGSEHQNQIRALGLAWWSSG